jgi:hypothetical protein
MRKRADAKGLAAIFDSLVFLCIIIVIVLAILDSPGNGGESEPWDRSATVHSVLIHSTLSMTESPFEESNCSEAPVAELLRQALSSSDRDLVDRLSRHLEPLSDALVEAPYHYRWVVSGISAEIAMGERSIPEDRDVTASKIEVELREGSYTSILYLWIL